MNEICAIVVTYNRKELLLRNINSLLVQTRKLDILIVDNHSTDDTKQYLEINNILSRTNVYYIDTGANIGGAGGFAFGLEHAYKQEYQWFLLMDDDGFCLNNNVVEILYDRANKFPFKAVFNAMVVKNDTPEMTFMLDGCGNYKDIIDRNPNGLYIGDINPFNSTFIPRSVINQIGYPRKEFFIYGDEYEYSLRIKNNGFKTVTVLDALYYHPENSRPNTFKLLGKTLQIYDMPIWKNYCSVRNKTFTLRLYGMNNKDTFRWGYRQLLEAWCCSGRKRVRIFYVLIALSDGMRGKFDRKLMFNKI